LSLADAADRRIARHASQGIPPKRDERSLGTQPRGGPGGLRAGVPATDHNDVELLRAHFSQL
jgi:hypothetical protein